MARGLLTEMERKALTGEVDDPNQRSTYITRVRQRLEERTAEDIRILSENEPELFEILREQIDSHSESNVKQ